MGKTYKKHYNDDDEFYSKKDYKNKNNKKSNKKLMNALKTKDLEILSNLQDEED